ncbi:hypothetical protein A4A49_53212, partial [Nicotiana attenuata]
LVYSDTSFSGLLFSLALPLICGCGAIWFCWSDLCISLGFSIHVFWLGYSPLHKGFSKITAFRARHQKHVTNASRNS